MAKSRRFGRRKRKDPLRRTQKVYTMATTALVVAVVTSLIGSTIAADNVRNDHNKNGRGGSSFENKHRGLRGDRAAMNDVEVAQFRSNKGRKRNKIRKLSVNETSTIVEKPGLPPLTHFAIKNLAGSWDNVPIRVDGSLQLPKQQYHTQTGLQGEGDNFTSLDASVSVSPIRPRIVGGSEDSDLDSFVMHLRYVQGDGMWKFAGCGGSLISKCHVLTAGHCMSGELFDRTKALYVNAWRPFSSNTDKSTGKTKPYHVSLIDVDRTATHPKFNNTGNLNDIAVLTMAKCIPDEQTELFEIMEIADNDFWRKMSRELLVDNDVSNDQEGAASTTRVAGFGQRDSNDPSVPPALQSVDVSLFGREDCEARYNDKLLFSSPINLIQPDMYCAGAPNGGKDACLGDSGGPNYYTQPETSLRTQLGVVSWGIGCAEEGFPGVYTSVAYHYDFIQNAVCGDERLGDFGASSIAASTPSQSAPTAGSPLKLCLPKSIPESNSASDGDLEKPIVIGDDTSSNQIKDSSLVEKEEVPNCFEKNQACRKDSECCGNDLFCHKRDEVCRTKPRGYKGRLADGVHGGSGSSQNIRKNNNG